MQTRDPNVENPDRLNFRFGSFASISRCPRQVRFGPDRDMRADIDLRRLGPITDMAPFRAGSYVDSLFRKTASRWAINACQAREAARSP